MNFDSFFERYMYNAIGSAVGSFTGLGALAIVFSLTGPSHSQDAKDRQNAALPILVEQRNNALDSVALCQGDLALLKAQLADVQKKLADAEAKLPK